VTIDPTTLGELWQTTGRAARYYGSSRLSVLLRFARLYLRDRYSRSEIFAWGLANPRLGAAELAKFISRERLYSLQLRINPPDYNYITEDKSIFYPFCKGAGISIPELYAVFDPAVGWASSNGSLQGRAEWCRFFNESAPQEFVIKPTLGVHGRAIGIYKKTNDGFVDFFGHQRSADDLYDSMSSDSLYDRFVIQERLANHSELLRLSGTAALQTLRMITITESGSSPTLLFAVQKIVGNEGAADNFSYGQKGNMVADVALDRGVLEKVVTGGTEGFDLREINEHPKTGVTFKGFRLPWWSEACDLVMAAAAKILPIRTVGWDVALTPNGPLIVEGNMWWHSDHHNALGQIERFLDRATKREPRSA